MYCELQKPLQNWPPRTATENVRKNIYYIYSPIYGYELCRLQSYFRQFISAALSHVSWIEILKHHLCIVRMQGQ